MHFITIASITGLILSQKCKQHLEWNIKRISQDFIMAMERDTLFIDCSAHGANTISLKKDGFHQKIGLVVIHELDTSMVYNKLG